MNTPLPNHQQCAEHLAVERTFLAWVRTSIALISLGFVVAEFSIWLHELVLRLDPQVQIRGMGMSLPMGVGMLAFGGVLTVLTAWHCNSVNQANKRGEVRDNRNLVVTVTVGVALLAVLMIIYMLPTARSQ